MYKFIDNPIKEAIEARYWNQGLCSIAIVASITKDIDWAAYIGSDQSKKEDETLKFVLDYGCKLSEKDARHFFPNIELPYRN